MDTASFVCLQRVDTCLLLMLVFVSRSFVRDAVDATLRDVADWLAGQWKVSESPLTNFVVKW